MKCHTCGDYIARGKKFNARKETVENEEYLNLKVFRFYIKCPVCMQEITFKTDPQSFDYVVEHGATANFKALKLAHQQAIEEEKEKEEEEKLNPMKLLENRTKASRREMENLEALEDLKEINQREIVVDYDELMRKKKEEFEAEMKRQEEEDEKFVQSIFNKRLLTIDENEEYESDEEIVEDEQMVNSIASDPPKELDSKPSSTLISTNTSKTSGSSFANPLNKRKLDLRSLVVVKKPKPCVDVVESKPSSSSAPNLQKPSGALSSLCSYSGSSDDDSS